MKKKIVIFYPEKEIMDMRVDRIENAAKKFDLSVEKICVHKLLFTDFGVFYDKQKMQFSKDNFYWMVSFPYASRNLSYLLKLQNINLYPLLHSIVYDLDDKFTAHCFFNQNNIPTLKTVWLTPQTIDEAIDLLGGFPLVIKTTLGSAGKGVDIVSTKEDIINFMQNQLKLGITTFTKKLSYVLQEYISENNGEDYRILCVRDKCLGVIKRKAQSGFKSNVSLGGTVENVTDRPDLEEMALNVMQKSGLFMGGIDFIDTKDGSKAIEINASPQFEGFERATGIDVAENVIKQLLQEKR